MANIFPLLIGKFMNLLLEWNFGYSATTATFYVDQSISHMTLSYSRCWFVNISHRLDESPQRKSNGVR